MARMAHTGSKENMVPKRSRIKYTPEQVAVLERVFDENHYPDTLYQEQLALDMNVSLDRVSIWFQNRRSRFKRQRQADHVTWMRRQIFQYADGKDPRIFGTPKLPIISPACHVLSPLDTQVTRGEPVGDTPPYSTANIGTPSCCSKHHLDQQYPLHDQHASVTHIGTPTRPSPAYQPRHLHCREKPSSMTRVATPTRPSPAYQPRPLHSREQPSSMTSVATTTRLPPAYQSNSTSMFQFSFAQFYDISQLSSVTSNIPSIHGISKSHVTSSPLSDNGYALISRQQHVPAASQPNHVLSTGYHSYNSVNTKEFKQTSGLIDSDSDDSPSKDKTLECLAQWC